METDACKAFVDFVDAPSELRSNTSRGLSSMSQKTGGVLGGLLGGDDDEPKDELGEIAEKESSASKMDQIAFKLFGSYFKGKEDTYAGYRKKINQARMEVGYDMYLSRITLYSIITGLIGAFLGVGIGPNFEIVGVYLEFDVFVNVFPHRAHPSSDSLGW